MMESSSTALSLCLYDNPASVLQTDFSPGAGNALQACIASIFHLPLDQVPNFITLPNYEEGIREFVLPHFRVHKIKSSRCEGKDVGKLCVLRGKSPRGDFGHVIVARCLENGFFENVWDPHPGSSFLDAGEPRGWYMVFDNKQTL